METNENSLNYKRIRPGAKALVVHDGKILIIKEELPDGSIIHDFPGGGIEYGESLDDAVKREVFEEVGLKIKPEKIVGSWHFMVPSLRDKNVQVHILCIGYQCSLLEEPVIDFSKNPAEENIIDTLWLTKDELLGEHRSLLRHSDMLAAVKNLKI